MYIDIDKHSDSILVLISIAYHMYIDMDKDGDCILVLISIAYDMFNFKDFLVFECYLLICIFLHCNK